MCGPGRRFTHGALGAATLIRRGQPTSNTPPRADPLLRRKLERGLQSCGPPPAAGLASPSGAASIGTDDVQKVRPRGALATRRGWHTASCRRSTRLSVVPHTCSYAAGMHLLASPFVPHHAPTPTHGVLPKPPAARTIKSQIANEMVHPVVAVHVVKQLASSWHASDGWSEPKERLPPGVAGCSSLLRRRVQGCAA